MTTTKKVGVWMDNASAHIMDVADNKPVTIIESEATYEEKQKILQKGETMMHNKEQQLQSKYYGNIAEKIKAYDEVLLFGPTNAKVELHNMLKEDAQFNHKKIEVKQSDKMTDNQEKAFVREYFQNK